MREFGEMVDYVLKVIAIIAFAVLAVITVPVWIIPYVVIKGVI